MKVLIAFAAVAAVAVAGPVQHRFVSPSGGATPIVDAFGNHVIVGPDGISNFPAVSPITIGPAVVDFPTDSEAVAVPENTPSAPTPLVQIVITVNGQEFTQTVPTPVVTPVAPSPVSPVSVGTPVAPGPVNVVDNVAVPVSPVSVGTPIVVSPVSVGTPVVDPVSVDTPLLPIPVVSQPAPIN